MPKYWCTRTFLKLVVSDQGVLGVGATEGFGESPASLTNNLQVVQNPCPHEWIFVEHVAATLRMSLDLRNRVEDVQEP
jgi:hypothetical protein